MRLTLRTLLAYLDDTLPPDQARAIGQKVAESEAARELIDRIKKVTRRRGLSTPATGEPGSPSDPNTVAEYLNDTLSADQLAQFEKTCLDSDVHLAEAAATHQILTLLLSEPVRVPPTARQRMYQLVKGRESTPGRKPGKTVPVAGELPEVPAAAADDADAAFLLGMRAYSRSEPWRRRAAPLAALAGLVAALALTIWLALPGPRPQGDAAGGPDLVVALPAGQPRPVALTGGPRRLEPAPPPLAVAPPPRPAAGTDDPGPAAPPGELVPAPAKPKTGRVLAGVVENPDAAVVVARAGPDGPWLRATAKEPGLSTADRIVCLPGYKAKVRLDPATDVELWANVPEQQPLIPVLETAVTFHPPAAGFDAELTVHAGRVYLTARRPTGAKVRVRFRDEAWDLTVPDEKTEVVVEVVHSLVRGVTRDLDPSELPLTEANVVVMKGAAGLRARYKDLPRLQANEAVSWTSKGAGLVGPTKLHAGTNDRESAYYSRYELPVGEQAKAAQQALLDLSKRAADRDSIRVAFAELLRDDRPADAVGRTAAGLAVLGHAAVGDLPPVIDALNDSNRLFVRGAAAFALPHALAAAPDGVEQFRRRLAEKLGLKEEQAAQAVRLVRGFSDEERRSPEALDQVLAALAGNTLVVRELAYWALRTLGTPDQPPPQSALMFNAADPPEARERAVKAWRKFTDDLKKAAGKDAPKK